MCVTAKPESITYRPVKTKIIHQSIILYIYLFLFFVTLGQTAKVVVEFLEVAINCIVFLKGFYPSSISHVIPS